MPSKLEIPQLPDGARIIQHAFVEERDQVLLLSDGQMLIKGQFYTPTGSVNFDKFTLCPVPHPSFKKIFLAPNAVFGLDLQNKMWEWGMISVGIGNLPRHLVAQIATIRNIPTLIEGLENEEIVDFAAALNHFVAVGADGRVWTWGMADRRLGRDQPTYPRDWTQQQRMDANCKTPTLLEFPDGALMARVEAREACSITIDRAGQLWCWGFSSKVFFDPRGEDKTVPTRIPQPEGVVFRSVAAAPDFFLALTTDGQVYGVGTC
jgi:alpha-tubulin suppressor-like RCC1 family protein